MKKNARIHFVVEPYKKNDWQKIADQNNMTLSEFIIHKVEGTLSKNERKNILKFIDISTNTDSKVENNINQIAKWVNTHHQITNEKMDEYLVELGKHQEILKERNFLFRKIISILSQI